ncbi:hypothetical protein Ancab_024784 [Ancistrocladus abbreviatus]
MGGCKESPSTCTNKTCHGYEVDIMHFSIGNAIPGRQYNSNSSDAGSGDDRLGHLIDVYAWNPYCQYLDGRGPSEMIPVHKMTGRGHGGIAASLFTQRVKYEKGKVTSKDGGTTGDQPMVAVVDGSKAKVRRERE